MIFYFHPQLEKNFRFFIFTLQIYFTFCVHSCAQSELLYVAEKCHYECIQYGKMNIQENIHFKKKAMSFRAEQRS